MAFIQSPKRPKKGNCFYQEQHICSAFDCISAKCFVNVEENNTILNEKR